MKKKSRPFLIGILVFFAFLCSFSKIVTFSVGQINGDSLPIYSNFSLIERAETQGDSINVSDIEYTFPSDSWDITELKLNFTEIKYDRGIHPIETKPVVAKQLQKNIARGLAVQIKIMETTQIYGAHLYGFKIKNATTTTITVQINGYDSVTDQPNNTIFASSSLNMTNETSWYIHNFASPVVLPKGDYFLVINGTEMSPPEQVDLWWYLNNINPSNPNLISWSYFGGIWTNNVTGQPFLYKLDQKVLADFYPSDINLTAQIEESNYIISDGFDLGSGDLTINSTIHLQEKEFNISIVSNSSFDVIFNVSYHFHLQNILISQGMGIVEDDLDNEWTLTPNIQRAFNNYSIQFNYPLSWQNISVFRKLGLSEVNINSEIILDEIDKKLIIPNSTILEGAEWRIAATSPKISFSLNFQFTDWYLGQKLDFSVFTPIDSGNLTFVLINPSNFENLIEVKEVFIEETIFNYTIPESSREGKYIAKIYWNNETDAGVQTKELHFTKRPTINLVPLIIIISSIGGTSVITVTLYIVGRHYRRKSLARKEKIYSNCIDILNLDYIMVTDKNSGLNVYTKNYSDKEVDPALVSGFLQAIHSFGIEMMKVEDRSQTIKLEYKDSIVLMTEFVNLRLILLMQEAPSRNFLFSLEDLAYDVYKNYGDLIDSFNGDVLPFKGIENLLKQHLNIIFISPLKIAKVEKLSRLRINQNERILINNAVRLMKTENKNFFF
ncbi:MAG: hypothetical protein ACFFD7_07565, partial [Candidatus Thorarchaeota archaeon]